MLGLEGSGLFLCLVCIKWDKVLLLHFWWKDLQFHLYMCLAPRECTIEHNCKLAASFLRTWDWTLLQKCSIHIHSVVAIIILYNCNISAELQQSLDTSGTLIPKGCGVWGKCRPGLRDPRDGWILFLHEAGFHQSSSQSSQNALRGRKLVQHHIIG